MKTEPQNFMDMAEKLWKENRFVCIGLDSDWEKIPVEYKSLGEEEGTFQFNRAIIDSTKDLVSSYKANLAFYEISREQELALEMTVEYIKKTAPEIPVIADAKRGDIGNTNLGYVKEVFERYGFDAITVHGYMGKESLQPFLERKDKVIFVLCKTSNPGSGEFQNLNIEHPVLGKIPLYKAVAYNVANEWNINGNCALVVGATYPIELKEIREIKGCNHIPLLIPGIGVQGGELEETVKAEKSGRMFIHSARGIIFAKRENDETVGDAAKRETLKLHEQILSYR